MERLQKVIANSGFTSRRKAEQLILEGKVKVNGIIVTELGYKVSDKDEIEVDGVPLNKEEKVYYLINKPRGCICAVSDDKNRPVVVDFLRKQGIKERVYPVGRLDYDTAGVLLLTNDGELTNLLTHPKSQIEKTYLVRCEGIVSNDDLRRLRTGVEIDGYVTQKAKVNLLSVDRKNKSSQVRITITEGKYHQVKKMFEAIGHPVKKLRRERFAFLDVEGLKPGEFRPLKVHEVKQLYVLARYGQPEKIKGYKIRRY